MRAFLFSLGLVATFAAPLHAAMVSRPIDYSVGQHKMQSVLVYDDAIKTTRPGLVMAPDWMGMNDNQIALAKQIAGKDYVILVADVYGIDVRPKTASEAGAASKTMYAHRADLRARMSSALEELKKQVGKAPLDGTHWGAIGFCFGGVAALDLARSGAAIGGVATFHGNLTTDDPALAKNIKAKVLVMNGGDDTFTSEQQIVAFQKEVRDAHVDWQFINYGGAVHCFAIPTADGSTPGCKYDPLVAKRAFAQMHRFFDEVFATAGAAPADPLSSTQRTGTERSVAHSQALEAVGAIASSGRTVLLAKKPTLQQGEALLWVTLAANGKTQEVSVVSGTGKASLDKAAVAAIRTWDFQPAADDPRGGYLVIREGNIPMASR